MATSSSLKTLRQEAANCRACPLWKNAIGEAACAGRLQTASVFSTSLIQYEVPNTIASSSKL